MKVYVWVMYDISVQKKRARIAGHCKDFGLIRFQKSIFLGETDKNAVSLLAGLIMESFEQKEEGDTEEDSVLIFTIGDHLLDNIVVLGKGFAEDEFRKPRVLIIG